MGRIIFVVIFVGLIAFAVADIPDPNTHYYTVDYFELNHTYDGDGKLTFDQMILWEWADYQYLDEDKRMRTRREPKVTDWYIVTKYRRKLTPEQQKKLDKELEQEWIKKFGKDAAANVPQATPQFDGGIEIPRYDLDRKRWKVIIRKRTGWVVIYATSFVETWTQFDPEVENQKLFSSNTRKYYLKRVK